MPPKLSVVIPVYNVEMYLRACLDSAVGQTLKDLEIIVVNDCSPDNSEVVILEYAKADSRIKYIKHEVNLGLGGARNTGIKHATGEWIAFLDSDDYLDLRCYEAILAKIQAASADMGIFGALYFEDGTNKPIMDMPFFSECVDAPVKANETNINTINATVWSKIYRLKDIVDNRVEFPERLKHEDDEFLFKYFAAVEPVIIGDATPYYYYRKRETSIMANVSSSRKDLPDLSLNIYNFLVAHDLLSKYRTAFIERMDFYCGALNALDLCYREEFIHKMSALLQNLKPSESELQPMRVVTKALAKKSVADQLIFLFENVELAVNDKWYKFGLLTPGEKAAKVFSFVVNRFRK